ncbi:replication initiation protein [Lutibacter sp. B2]|nr:replication initiation protein [Lutibacter sp. B2]
MKTEGLIKLHNSIGEARYKLNLAEQKFFIYAVMQIRQENENFERVQFNIKDFANFVNLDIKRLYTDIDRIIENVMSLVISVKKSNKKWSKYNLTQKCEYENGHIEFKFNADMKPFLLKLKEHYFLENPNVIKFRSWYSIRLYDLLKSVAYKQVKHNQGAFIYLLEDLKEILRLEGKYSRFNSFREKVIEPAMTEINEKSDISFEYEKIMKGRSVSALKFIISENADEDIVFLDKLYPKEKIEEIKIKTGLTKENFNIKQIIELCEIAVLKAESIDVDIHDYIRINYEEMLKKKTARNKFAWLKKALEEDYASAIAQIKLNYRIGS